MRVETSDFTLYLHDIDPNQFSSDCSRFGGTNFAEEWRLAWAAYEVHVKNAPLPEDCTAKVFALGSWRQDLRNVNCIRKKPINVCSFNALTQVAEIEIFNPLTGLSLPLIYKEVTDYYWDSNVSSGGAFDFDSSAESIALEVLVEEVRFDALGALEHEFRFIDGSCLVIFAGSLDVSLGNYLRSSGSGLES